MKRGKVFLLAAVCLVLVLCSIRISQADTLLFPVLVVNQPNVTSIISVMNESSAATYLHYIYRVKDGLSGGSPNITGDCSPVAFTRPTYYHDLVSFDASGTFNGGNALFGDTDSYGGGFGVGLAGAKRGYLLVTHSNGSGTRVNVLSNSALVGEAIILDIADGAAWGYKAINDTEREDYTFSTTGVPSAMYYGASPSNYRGFNFFPLNEWTTRFFVTPIGASMDTANLEATVRLSTALHVINRTGIEYSFDPPLINPTCTAAIDLAAMMDATTLSAVNATGGYSRFCVQSGGTQPGNPVVAYKLEYVFDNPTYGGTNNNAYLLTSTGDMP